MSRWDELTGGGAGEAYARRFAALAASGQDVHGEAALVAALVPPGSAILDAGCGTGRVAVRLAELGYEVVGVDLDPSMLEVARRTAPGLTWITADLAELDLPQRFDLIVAAGNVVPLVAPGTEAEVVRRLAALLRPGGLLVAGFGLDREHLPVPPVLTLETYDRHCSRAGLTLTDRYATWSAEPYTGGGYAVSVHRAPARTPTARAPQDEARPQGA